MASGHAPTRPGVHRRCSLRLLALAAVACGGTPPDRARSGADTPGLARSSTPPPCDTSTTGLTFLGNFEGRDPYAGWSLYEAKGTPWALSVVDSVRRECRQAARFELRRRDPLMGRNHRTEIKLQSTRGNGPVLAPEGENPVGTLGREVWIGWSVNIPSDWVIEPRYAPETIMQVAQAGRSPAFEVQIDGSEFKTFSRTGTGRRNDSSGTDDRDWETTVNSTTPMRRGAWTDFVVHARWSAGPDGLLEIWQDGNKIVERAGPNAFTDWSSTPYLKLGIYKWSWKRDNSVVSSRVLYLDAVRLVSGSTGSYDLVAPR